MYLIKVANKQTLGGFLPWKCIPCSDFEKQDVTISEQGKGIRSEAAQPPLPEPPFLM